jgi:hypothetical protein
VSASIFTAACCLSMSASLPHRPTTLTVINL